MTLLQNRKPVLIVRLRGGLGNQLFEYAAGRCLAQRNGVPLWLDTVTGFQGDRYGRSYELQPFHLGDRDVEEMPALSLGVRAELFRRFVGRRELLRMRLLGRYFDPAIYNLGIRRPTVLDAYCQSPRYFGEIEEQLRQELEFKQLPDGLDALLLNDIRQGNSVCLHARRLHGQEANGTRPQPVADFYGACDTAYYRAAIREISGLHGTPKVFLFSDDIDWARQNASAFEVTGTRVTVIEDANPLRTFYLMTQCRHFIIANSTFSWWAAWLGKHQGKTVCAPDVWNRGERRFPRDLFPEAWRIVPTTPAIATTAPAASQMIHVER